MWINIQLPCEEMFFIKAEQGENILAADVSGGWNRL